MDSSSCRGILGILERAQLSFHCFLGCAAVALPSSDIASSSETDKPQPDCPPEKVDQIRESLWDLKQEIGTETTPQETEPRTE